MKVRQKKRFKFTTKRFLDRNGPFIMLFKVTAAIIASVKASTSLDICEADYQGINERVLACPGGRINIISAEYGRPGDDRETCCANKRKCWVKPGTTCTANALDWVKTKCEGKTLAEFRHHFNNRVTL